MLKDENTFVIAIVTAGAVIAGVGGEDHLLHAYEKLFLPAGIGPVPFTPVNGPAAILECLPPA